MSENEKIKKELNPTKIDEPKTPYWSPLETTDEDLELGVSPLSLSESYMQDQVMKSMWEHGNGSPPPSIRENGQGTSSSCGSRKSLDRYYGDGVPEDDNEDTVQKRQRFLEARKMHYKISKELLYVYFLSRMCVFLMYIPCMWSHTFGECLQVKKAR